MGSETLIDGISEPTENWFKFPTEVIEYLPDMTEKEIKSFIYIVRHTWGFHDNEKKITLDEFVNGRKRKDGSRMDNGCGLSKPSVVAALALLKHKGFINTRTNGDKAREKVYYSLRLKILTPKIEQELKILTPDDQNRGKKSLPRSEKDTLNTKEEKDTSYEDTDVSSIADATASVAAADFEPVKEKKKREPSTKQRIIEIIAIELATNESKTLDSLDGKAKGLLFGQAGAIWKRELMTVHKESPIDPEDFEAYCKARRSKGWFFPVKEGNLQGGYATWLMNDHSIPEIQKKSQPPRQSQYENKADYPPPRLARNPRANRHNPVPDVGIVAPLESTLTRDEIRRNLGLEPLNGQPKAANQ